MKHNDNDMMTRRLGSPTQGVCALVQDMLPFYLEDDVSGQSRAFINEHLETCDRCASFLAGGRSVQEHLRRDSALRTENVARDVRAQDVVTRGRQQLMGYTLIGAGIAALVVIGVVFGFGGLGLRMTAGAPAAPLAVEAVRAPDAFVVVPPVPTVVPPDGIAGEGPTPTPVPYNLPTAIAPGDAVPVAPVPPAIP